MCLFNVFKLVAYASNVIPLQQVFSNGSESEYFEYFFEK